MKDEGLIKDRTELILKELQSILTIAYLSVILIGMIDSYFYYKEFGINIFEYSEVFDFLIAPFRKTITLVYLGFAVLAGLLGYLLDVLIEKYLPALHKKLNFGLTKKPWFKTYRLISFLTVIFVLLISASKETGEKMQEHLIKLKGYDTNIIFDSASDKSVKGFKVGMTSNYIFLLDSSKTIQIIPINNQVEKILLEREVVLE